MCTYGVHYAIMPVVVCVCVCVHLSFSFCSVLSQAFTDKNYPVESNQAKWISMVVDFFVDSIINIAVSKDSVEGHTHTCTHA